MITFILYLPMPSGKTWSKFWETSKSVKEVRPLISSGRHSNLFSETSRQSRFFRFPTSCNTRWNFSHAPTCHKAIWKMCYHIEIPERKATLCMTSKCWKKYVSKFCMINQPSCSFLFYISQLALVALQATLSIPRQAPTKTE